jgi:hypothetical protein
VARIRKGDYMPDPWFTAKPGAGWGSWGIKAQPGRRGLTLMDTNAADGASFPEKGAPTILARGAAPDSSLFAKEWGVPYKYDSWADNVVSLYEEAVARQWCAASAIPWADLQPLPYELERAFCQILTFFTTTEYLANDTLGQWLAKIPSSYHEVKLFLAAQIMDEARHTEVFRKRIFANGGGMGISFVTTGNTTAVAGVSAGWTGVSFGIQVFFESVVLDLFRYAEFLGKTPVDKVIFQRVMQDEARHVSYGTMHLKYYMDHMPKEDREENILKLHAVADASELSFAGGFLVHPTVLQGLAILAGGGVANMQKGYETYRELWSKIREEYLRRCERAGFDRRSRCLMPAEASF